jgi:hypothetical protein
VITGGGGWGLGGLAGGVGGEGDGGMNGGDGGLGGGEGAFVSVQNPIPESAERSFETPPKNEVTVP